MRGFASNGIGPRDVTPGTTMDNIGGNIYWGTSTEVQSAVPFIPSDAGYAGVGPDFLPWLVSAALFVCGALLLRQALVSGAGPVT